MAEFPAMPLFTDAYLGDTRHLTTIEHGAYLLLLIVAWRRDGALPDDDKLLARYTGLTLGQWRRISPTIREFFTAENGALVQQRQRDELDHVRRVRDSQSANGKASALKRKGRHATKRERSVNQSSTPSPSPTKVDSANAESTNARDLAFHAPQPEWANFVEHRKAKGKPVTPRAVKLNLATLERLAAEGHDPRAVLNQSIENGWTGLFRLDGGASRNAAGSGAGRAKPKRFSVGDALFEQVLGGDADAGGPADSGRDEFHGAGERPGDAGAHRALAKGGGGARGGAGPGQ